MSEQEKLNIFEKLNKTTHKIKRQFSPSTIKVLQMDEEEINSLFASYKKDPTNTIILKNIGYLLKSLKPQEIYDVIHGYSTSKKAVDPDSYSSFLGIVGLLVKHRDLPKGLLELIYESKMLKDKQFISRSGFKLKFYILHSIYVAKEKGEKLPKVSLEFLESKKKKKSKHYAKVIERVYGADYLRNYPIARTFQEVMSTISSMITTLDEDKIKTIEYICGEINNGTIKLDEKEVSIIKMIMTKMFDKYNLENISKYKEIKKFLS